MKWVGALLFVATTTYIGFDISRSYSKRTSQLRNLIHSLQILEAEMGYSRQPLQIIFQAVSKTTKPPLHDFYANLSRSMQEVVTDFYQVWEAELFVLQNNTSLKQNEIEIMSQFGKSLGQHVFTQQQKQIMLTIHHLQRELDEAEEQRYKYEKMVKTLGILIGLFIVLLII